MHLTHSFAKTFFFSPHSLNNEPGIFSSLDYSRISENTQGYEDSDISPTKLILKKRRAKSSHRRKVRRNDHPYLADIDSCESNFSNTPAVQKVSPNSSNDSEVYRSESYQLLMLSTRPLTQLQKIDETSPTQCELDTVNRPNSQATVTPIVPLNVDVNFQVDIPSCDTSAPITETGSLGGNSSNISFPLSPELSIVEKLSVVQDLISGSTEGHPTLNETHASGLADANNYNKYFISDVDISVPLMAQNCELRQNQVHNYEKGTKNIHSVNMQEPSSPDSLDSKLQNLLIASVKKIKTGHSKGQIKCNLMESDPMTTEVQTKKTTKRCSTPCKRKSSKIQKPDAETLVEHTQTPDAETLVDNTPSCSHGAKSMCPPTINVIASEEQMDNNNLNESDKTVATNKTRGRKKENVIKVKIQRPKRTRSSGRISVCTDSGITDTESGVFLQECYSCHDSINLIHNHSDTCLQSNECLGDSVELIENVSKSPISIHDSSSIQQVDLETDCRSGHILTSKMFNKRDEDDFSRTSGKLPIFIEL